MKSKMQIRCLIWASAIVALLTFVRCATIISGTSQSISITSAPLQATVEIKESPGGKTVFEGKTPATCKLPRNKAYDVYISMPGYREERVHITQSFNPVFLGNLILGGLPGMIVDLITGAVNELKPATINVTLQQAYNNDGHSIYYAQVEINDGYTGSKVFSVRLDKAGVSK